MWSRTDDLDGHSKAEQEVFGFDGKAYVVDLSTTSKEALRKALQPFLTVATEYDVLPTPPEFPTVSVKAARSVATKAAPSAPRTNSRKRRATRGAASADPVSHRTIRAWAMTEGFPVTEKGRISNEVLEAYRVAHD